MLAAVTAEIEALENRMTEDLDNLAERVRQELVIPVCLKHGLQFLSGNGTFAFFRGKAVYGRPGWNHERMSPALKAALEPVFEVLCLHIGRDDQVGFHVGDVIPRKIRREMKKAEKTQEFHRDLVPGFDFYSRRCQDRTGY